MIKSSSRASSVAFRPSTSFMYSDCSFSASEDFISSIFRSRFLAPLDAFRNESSVKSILTNMLMYAYCIDKRVPPERFDSDVIDIVSLENIREQTTCIRKVIDPSVPRQKQQYSLWTAPLRLALQSWDPEDSDNYKL